jgi:hypothetical protein
MFDVGAATGDSSDHTMFIDHQARRPSADLILYVDRFGA